MEAVKQEDGLGCAVACVAFLLNIPYSEAVTLFADGKRRVREEANFYCPEITQILNDAGFKYGWKKLSEKPEDIIYNNYSIVFIERSPKYPYGHFLCRYDGKWMDPYINLPNNNIEAGFRKELPGKPTYTVYQI